MGLVQGPACPPARPVVLVAVWCPVLVQRPQLRHPKQRWSRVNWVAKGPDCVSACVSNGKHWCTGRIMNEMSGTVCLLWDLGRHEQW